MAQHSCWCIHPGCGQISYTDDKLCINHSPGEGIHPKPGADPRTAQEQLEDARTRALTAFYANMAVPNLILGDPVDVTVFGDKEPRYVGGPSINLNHSVTMARLRRLAEASSAPAEALIRDSLAPVLRDLYAKLDEEDR